MSVRQRISIAILWTASIVAVGAWARAQAPAPSGPAPTIVSGNDLGFRIDSRKGSTPVGTLVIRVNGQWVEPDFAVGMKRLTTR